MLLKSRVSRKKNSERARKKLGRERKQASKEKKRQKLIERQKRIERYNKKHNITARRLWTDYDYDYIDALPRNVTDITAKSSASIAPQAAVGQNFNVLVILANQFRHDAIGSSVGGAGSYDLSRVAKTPHLSALCKSGVCFKQAVAHAPASVPSRAVILTGTTDNATGVQGASDSRVVWDGRRTFADLLKRRGYLTLFYGEWGQTTSICSPNLTIPCSVGNWLILTNGCSWTTAPNSKQPTHTGWETHTDFL